MNKKRSFDQISKDSISNKTRKTGAKTKAIVYVDPCAILWQQQPFWDLLYEYIPSPLNQFGWTCKKALEVQQKWCHSFILLKSNDIQKNNYFSKYFTNIVRITLPNSCLTNISNRHTLKYLNHLDLSNFQNPLKRFNIKQFPNIKSLNLSNTRFDLDIELEDIQYFGKMPIFQQINGLSQCTKLDTLSLGGYLTIDNDIIRSIKYLKRLKRLDLSQYLSWYQIPHNRRQSNFFSDGMINLALPQLPLLRSLSLGGCRQIDDFSFLEHLPLLEELDLSNTNIDEELEHLKNMPNLRCLAVRQIEFVLITQYLAFITTLASLKQIRHICLAGTNYYNSLLPHTNIVDQDLILKGKILLPDFSIFTHLDSICICGSHLYGLDMCQVIEKITIRLPKIKAIHLHNPVQVSLEMTCRQPPIDMGLITLQSDCRDHYFLTPHSNRHWR